MKKNYIYEIKITDINNKITHESINVLLKLRNEFNNFQMMELYNTKSNSTLDKMWGMSPSRLSDPRYVITELGHKRNFPEYFL